MTDTSHGALLSAALHDRSVWDELEAAGEAVNFPEDMLPAVQYAREFYHADPNASRVDPSLMRSALLGTVRDPKRQEHLKHLLQELLSAPPSVPNAKLAVRAVRARRVSEQLATKLLLPIRTEKDDGQTIISLIDEYVGLTEASDQEESPSWTKECISPSLGQPRIPVYPKSVAEKLRGGLWPGHHVTVFARPEVGKSAFALTAAVMAAARGKARVLYLTNEDPVRDLMLRSLCLFSRQGSEDVIAHLDESIDAARRFGAERLAFRDMAPGSLPEIDRLTRRYKPDLLIVDQMRNIGVGKFAENMTQRLDAVAQGLRNVGKRHDCAVLSITQAGDSARDKVTLDDGDVDYSNTGIAAGCDVLIGIGCNEVMRTAGERRLTFIKNKLGGTHGYVDVRLDPVTLAFKDK